MSFSSCLTLSLLCRCQVDLDADNAARHRFTTYSSTALLHQGQLLSQGQVSPRSRPLRRNHFYPSFIPPFVAVATNIVAMVSPPVKYSMSHWWSWLRCLHLEFLYQTASPITHRSSSSVALSKKQRRFLHCEVPHSNVIHELS